MQPGYISAVYPSKKIEYFIKFKDRTKLINMKRIVKLIAAVVLLAMLSAACSHYVCPAYSSEKASEENIAEPS